MTTPTPAAASRVRGLAASAVPAAVIGIGASLVLVVISGAAEALQDLVWDTWPSALGRDPSSAPWVVGILTATGLLVGVGVWLLPGHAGPDPATQGLIAPPLAPSVLPGLVVVTVLALAGGVSVGPENPIIAVNIALTVAVGGRVVRRLGAGPLGVLAAAGTIGALFATPVGAALVFSEQPSAPGSPPLFDRLFAPMVAAVAGSLTTTVLAQPVLAVDVAPYRGPGVVDALSAAAIGLAAALVMLVDVYAFPRVHAAFGRLRHPVVTLTIGGAVLGVLGVVGGPITLFKGLDEMKQLVLDDPTAGRLTVIVAVKLVALLVASTCGFRGGRIFPAVFIGVAFGLLAQAVVPSVPPAVAVSAGVLGTTLAVTHDGWLSLFMAAVIVPDLDLIPVLVVAILPLWLLVTTAPTMLVPPSAGPVPPARGGPAGSPA